MEKLFIVVLAVAVMLYTSPVDGKRKNNHQKANQMPRGHFRGHHKKAFQGQSVKRDLSQNYIDDNQTQQLVGQFDAIVGGDQLTNSSKQNFTVGNQKVLNDSVSSQTFEAVANVSTEMEGDRNETFRVNNFNKMLSIVIQKSDNITDPTIQVKMKELNKDVAIDILKNETKNTQSEVLNQEEIAPIKEENVQEKSEIHLDSKPTTLEKNTERNKTNETVVVVTNFKNDKNETKAEAKEVVKEALDVQLGDKKQNESIKSSDIVMAIAEGSVVIPSLEEKPTINSTQEENVLNQSVDEIELPPVRLLTLPYNIVPTGNGDEDSLNQSVNVEKTDKGNFSMVKSNETERKDLEEPPVRKTTLEIVAEIVAEETKVQNETITKDLEKNEGEKKSSIIVNDLVLMKGVNSTNNEKKVEDKQKVQNI